ncbi:hypothetical protein ACFSJW_04540 [Flavobacterium artemisiae]|uniref:LlaJI restriction endonuclease n=1 Tax=Flavobacterium artemisiae TaxID=2126556 RepID=A0ABW4HL06_9FLAO
MATVKIKEYTVLTYESDKFQPIYWKKMSASIFEKYGKQKIDDFDLVNNILNDCFEFLIHEFTEIINQIDDISFFKYCFHLHEDSLKILIDPDKNLIFKDYINEADFSRYRRILKLILEQGCEKEFTTSKKTSPEDFIEFDDIIQRLFYLGTWLYVIADHIAYHRMLEGAKIINFDDDDLLIEWKNDYGKIYTHLFTNSYDDYEKAAFDEKCTEELINSLNQNYGIDYDFACGMIFEIQKHHSNSPFQTIEPYVLPINLSKHSKIDLDLAKQFYDGLSLKKENKLSIKECILKPYSTDRYLFKPLLIYNIKGVERMFVSKNKFAESIFVIASNAINWNTLSKEWLKNEKMQNFINMKGNQHDKILEDQIQEHIKNNNLKFSRNITSLKTTTKNNYNIIDKCGEIDFIIIDDQNKRIIVADSKYNKARYEGIGYRSDYTNFIKYESQIGKKIIWIKDNIDKIEIHFKKLYNDDNLKLNEFTVTGAFFINTPTFYMYNSKYSVATLNKIDNYLKNINITPDIRIIFEDKKYDYSYPYFGRAQD